MQEQQIIIVVVILAVITYITYLLLKKLSNKSDDNSNEYNIANNNMGNTQGINENQLDDFNNQDNNRHAAQINAPVIDPNKNYTKKELHKMEKKKAKADARENMEEYLKQKKLREIEKEKEYLEKEAKRKEEEAKEEEIINKIREDKAKKEEEEYAKWEKAFAVKEEGEEKEEFNDKVINEFLNYVKIRKVISLEDLAGTFKMNSNEVIQRLNFLEESGRICGIIDDRGKYIYLTEKELTNIEKYFGNKGRVSKSELVAQSNKLIRFEPTEEDKEIINKQNLEIIKDVEERENEKLK